MAAPKGATVGHYIDDDLDYIQRGRTLQRSALFIYKALTERFGKVGIEQLSASHLKAFIQVPKYFDLSGRQFHRQIILNSTVTGIWQANVAFAHKFFGR